MAPLCCEIQRSLPAVRDKPEGSKLNPLATNQSVKSQGTPLNHWTPVNLHVSPLNQTHSCKQDPDISQTVIPSSSPAFTFYFPFMPLPPLSFSVIYNDNVLAQSRIISLQITHNWKVSCEDLKNIGGWEGSTAGEWSEGPKRARRIKKEEKKKMAVQGGCDVRAKEC